MYQRVFPLSRGVVLRDVRRDRRIEGMMERAVPLGGGEFNVRKETS